jgi:hypothetical protein
VLGFNLGKEVTKLTGSELLAELRQLGVSLTVDENNLHYTAPKGVLTDKIRQAVKAHKADLLELLRTDAVPPQAVPTDQQGVSENKSKPPDTTDTPEGRAKLEALLAQHPEARSLVNDALAKGAWIGNCVGALRQWDLGDPEYAKQIMSDWVVYWKGYPQNYEASLEEVREASIKRR